MRGRRELTFLDAVGDHSDEVHEGLNLLDNLPFHEDPANNHKSAKAIDKKQ